MKKMFFQFVFVYMFSLIAAAILLIFKSRISEGSYLVVQLVLFGYSILTGMLYFLPRFILGLIKIIFKNDLDNPDDYPKDSTYWWIIVAIVLLLGVFFKMTLIIPIAVIIQSSYILGYILFKLKTLNLTNLEE